MIMFDSSRCGGRTAVTRVSRRHFSPNRDSQAAIVTGRLPNRRTFSAPAYADGLSMDSRRMIELIPRDLIIGSASLNRGLRSLQVLTADPGTTRTNR